MVIPAQLPLPTNGATAPPVLPFAGLKAGDAVLAQVLGQNSAGLTLLSLAGRQIQLALPLALPAGSNLTLGVQAGPNGLQFVISPTNTPVPGGQNARAAVPASPLAPPPGINPPSSGALAAAPVTLNPPQPGPVPNPIPGPTPSLSSSAVPSNAPSIAAGAGQPSTVSTAASAGPASASPTGTNTASPPPPGAPPAPGPNPGVPIAGAPISSAPAGQNSAVPVQSEAASNATPLNPAPVAANPPASIPATVSVPVSASAIATVTASTTAAVVQSATTGPTPTGATGATTGVPASAPSPLVAAAGVPPQPAGPQAPNAQLATPAAAAPTQAQIVARAALVSLGNQASVTGLVATILQAGNRLRELPTPVQQAVTAFAASILPLGETPPRAAELARAIARSGVFLEAALGPVSTIGPGPVPPAGDVKNLMLILRGALANWLGPEVTNNTNTKRSAPPPQRGMVPRAAPTTPLPLSDENDADQLGRSLLAQTDAALSRTRLLQIASLPTNREAHAGPRVDTQTEIPFVLGQEPGTLHFRISRDNEQSKGREKNEGWRIQFALRASIIGEIGADVSFSGGRIGTVLWAEEQHTADALNAGLPDLQLALEAAGLKTGLLRVRRQSATPADARATPSGGYVDRAS